MERLTAQEESVMLYIWKLGSCFIRDILNEMPDPKPPYTSVASVVRNLEKKKYVTPKKFGTITLFSPRVKEAEYKRTFMSNVVQNYFTGSYKEMVSFFVRDRKFKSRKTKSDGREKRKAIFEAKTKCAQKSRLLPPSGQNTSVVQTPFESCLNDAFLLNFLLKYHLKPIANLAKNRIFT